LRRMTLWHTKLNCRLRTHLCSGPTLSGSFRDDARCKHERNSSVPGTGSDLRNIVNLVVDRRDWSLLVSLTQLRTVGRLTSDLIDFLLLPDLLDCERVGLGRAWSRSVSLGAGDVLILVLVVGDWSCSCTHGSALSMLRLAEALLVLLTPELDRLSFLGPS